MYRQLLQELHANATNVILYYNQQRYTFLSLVRRIKQANFLTIAKNTTKFNSSGRKNA